MIPTAVEPARGATSADAGRRVRRPSRRDVERYLRLRAASRRLNHSLLAAVPSEAMDYVGDAIGILFGKTLFFESESVAAVLADCCFHDWPAGGPSIVQRYADETPPLEGTYEHELIQAMLRARYDVFDIVDRRPDAGVRASSLVDGSEFFILDLDLAHSADAEEVVRAARLLPAGEFRMTSAPALEIDRAVAVALLKTFARAAPSRSDGPGVPLEDAELVLTIVRACLECGRTRARGVEAALELGRTA